MSGSNSKSDPVVVGFCFVCRDVPRNLDSGKTGIADRNIFLCMRSVFWHVDDDENLLLINQMIY